MFTFVMRQGLFNENRVITTPLLLMDLLLTAGMPWPTILYTLLIDEIMIITGLIGALVSSSYKVSSKILVSRNSR